MSKKFPYGYDVNKYIEKAIEKMKYLYPWVTRDMFDKRREYFIKKIGNSYQYAYIYHWDNDDVKTLLDCDGEGFIKEIIERERFSVESSNKVKDVFVVPNGEGKRIHGWYLERYEFRSHELGGYSLFTQAGDRVAGGSRTFFIPNDYFDGSFSNFLDKYFELVPSYFGFTKEELKNAKGLKEFLGFN